MEDTIVAMRGAGIQVVLRVFVYKFLIASFSSQSEFESKLRGFVRILQSWPLI